MTQHQRVTFERARDVLQHALEYLTQTEAVLKDAEDQQLNERERLLLNGFLKKQAELRSALTAYQQDAPDRVMNTFIQFTTELPEDGTELEHPLTTASMTRWLERRNTHLSKLFQEIADAASAESIGTAFTGLNDSVEAHNRELSKEYLRLEDL